jgi:hypothetical protein
MNEYYGVCRPLDKFNFVIDVSSSVENKRKLISMYESQVKNIRNDEQVLTIRN